MISLYRFVSAAFAILCCLCASADIVHVPGDQPNIQAGISAATIGDVVLVADGTYTGPDNKNLDFSGKAVTVASENGAEGCIIDCESSGRGFYFHSGETQNSILQGFTIQNGRANYENGGGILCETNPRIISCILRDNSCIGVTFQQHCRKAIL
jgi:hypothetical protein